MTDTFTLEFNRKLGLLVGTTKPRARKCSHRSFYPEGHDGELELIRCAKCNVLFKFDGVRKVRA